MKHTTLLSCLFGLCCVICAALLPYSDAVAAEGPESKKLPTAIKADRMEYNADGQTVVFNGNVYVKRPDFELWSAKLTVYLDKSAKKPNETEEAAGAAGMQAGDIDRIVAEKDVRMKSNDKEGSCQKATYYAKMDKFVMEGNPLLKDKDKNNITGTVITHFLKANRSEVQSPKAIFFTQDKTENSTSLIPGSKSNTPLVPGHKPKGNR